MNVTVLIVCVALGVWALFGFGIAVWGWFVHRSGDRHPPGRPNDLGDV